MGGLPKRSAPSHREETKAAPEPKRSPAPASLMPVPQNHAQNLRAPRAQCEADANLMCASAHLKAEQTIEPDGREQNREECETGEKSRHDVSVGKRVLDRAVHTGDRDVAVQPSHDASEKRCYGLGLSRGAKRNLHRGLGSLCIRQVEHGAWFFPEASNGAWSIVQPGSSLPSKFQLSKRRGELGMGVGPHRKPEVDGDDKVKSRRHDVDDLSRGAVDRQAPPQGRG